MGWKLSDLVSLFPISEKEVEVKPPSVEDDSCRKSDRSHVVL